MPTNARTSAPRTRCGPRSKGAALTQLLGATNLKWGGTTPTANGVWFVKDIPNNATYVYADINGNASTPEIAIKLVGLHNLTNNDFLGVNNAAVTITAATTTASGAVSEIADGAVGENTTNRTTSGLIDFNDVDFGSVHTASFVPQGAGYVGGFSLGTMDDVNTKVGWSFSVPDSAVDFLAAGQTLVQKYNVTVDDGAGGTAVQTVTVTVTGTNDAPIVAATDVTGAVTELVSPVGNLMDTGTIAFTDVDLIDAHSLSEVTPFRRPTFASPRFATTPRPWSPARCSTSRPTGWWTATTVSRITWRRSRRTRPR